MCFVLASCGKADPIVLPDRDNIANLNVDTVDIGVAVVSMHAPYEVVSKLDVYMTYKAYNSFFQMR